jgi:site-specific DNA-methyltransferase (adenine-specific)
VTRTTDHRVVQGDARELGRPDDSVELVVTSPPYPMIELWDDAFSALSDDAATALESSDGDAAFDAMHRVLDAVWDEVARVLVDGGIVCVNVGDATRSIGGEFARYPNGARIERALRDRGLTPLPSIRWRKPTNGPTKFMGSGTLPTNAYVTHEHEQILIFRNGGTRSFPPGDRDRYESAFFWEERNRWFSDLWSNLPGTDQALEDETRDRAAAFPLAIPYRLIAMYSVYGDTVLDPFWGTGTSSLAAMALARDSVGVDRDAGLLELGEERLAEAAIERSREWNARRLERHERFLAERGEPPAYEATDYDTRVVTTAEQDLRLYTVADVTRTPDGFRADHVPFAADET